MSPLAELALRIPDEAKDLRLNLERVLDPTDAALAPELRFGVALAAAYAVRSPRLREALEAVARQHVSEAVLEDARAAAALMAMNNVYYRFRHSVGKGAYEQMSPRLRMQRIARPATSREAFELQCLAVSALNGCAWCSAAHEDAVRKAGLGEEQVHEAVRIAAVVAGAATALDLGKPS
jgi:alkyl hydroperoxide reductase subunit D